MSGYHVLVCGSRDWTDTESIYRILDGYNRRAAHLTVINGGARGADHIARQWADWAKVAEFARITLKTYEADWDTHGKAAGPIRNVAMLDAKPDVVWAFVTRPLEESHGTADMVRRAKAAGVPTYVVSKP